MTAFARADIAETRSHIEARQGCVVALHLIQNAAAVAMGFGQVPVEGKRLIAACKRLG